MAYISGTVLNQIALNGQVLLTQPTTHGWNPRTEIGVDGNGVSVYVSPREYFLKFDALDTEEFQQLYSVFQAQGVTGSIVSVLPQFNGNPYGWMAYSGTQIREPTYEGYNMNYYSNVSLLIVKINGT